MKPDHIRTSIDIPKRLHFELKVAAKLNNCSINELLMDGLADKIERIVDDYEGPVDSATMKMMEQVYQMRKDEAYLSEVQKETLRKLREG